MALINYPVDEQAVEESFDVIPAGEYIAIIENSDYTPNKKGSGQYLKLTYQIIDGPMKGRKLFEILNIENNSNQAQQIARNSLNSIALAVGIKIVIRDSSELHNKPLKIDVRIKGEDTDQYGKQNYIKYHLSLNEGASTPTTSNEKPTETKKHPWEK